MAHAVTTTARRYAEAIFEIALRDDTVGEWREQLDALSAALADPALAHGLQQPGVPLEERMAVLQRAIGKSALPQAANLMGLLLRRRRLQSLADIGREFRRLYNRREGIVLATATSAAPLADGEVSSLRRRLEEMTGGTVELDLSVDPALLGGVQVRLGDQLIDGSVRGRLERLRNQLTSGSLTP